MLYYIHAFYMDILKRNCYYSKMLNKLLKSEFCGFFIFKNNVPEVFKRYADYFKKQKPHKNTLSVKFYIVN